MLKIIDVLFNGRKKEINEIISIVEECENGDIELDTDEFYSKYEKASSDLLEIMKDRKTKEEIVKVAEIILYVIDASKTESYYMREAFSDRMKKSAKVKKKILDAMRPKSMVQEIFSIKNAMVVFIFIVLTGSSIILVAKAMSIYAPDLYGAILTLAKGRS